MSMNHRFCTRCDEFERRINSHSVDLRIMTDRLNYAVQERIQAESQYKQLVAIVGDNLPILLKQGNYSKAK